MQWKHTFVRDAFICHWMFFIRVTFGHGVVLKKHKTMCRSHGATIIEKMSQHVIYTWSHVLLFCLSGLLEIHPEVVLLCPSVCLICWCWVPNLSKGETSDCRWKRRQRLSGESESDKYAAKYRNDQITSHFRRGSTYIPLFISNIKQF